MNFLKDLFGFLGARKKLWLIPILVTLTVLFLLVFVSSNPAVAPFIYTLF